MVRPVRRHRSSGLALAGLSACLVLAGCENTPTERSAPTAQALGTATPGITFRTVLGGRFVGAVNDGGGAVIAQATVAQAWETFTLVDINGGSLQSGDSVFVRAGNGQYFQAANGGGSTLDAASNNTLGWETFTIVKQGGSSAIASGDVVGLQDSTGTWVSAANGGGGSVFAYGASLGPWEELTIGGLSAAPSPPPPPTQPTTVSNVHFRTTLLNRFVGAQNDGGGAVIAQATVAQAWETFTLVDVNGGSLASGDSVFVRAGNGQYFQAASGGGSTLNAASNNTLGWETFTIVKQGGSSAIASGDVVGLQDSTGTWVSAANGGGGSVFAYGASLGPWEELTIGGLSAAPSPPPPPTQPTTVSNVHFRTTLLNRFVGAQNDGGGAVIAQATVAQAWETFTLVDVNRSEERRVG